MSNKLLTRWLGYQALNVPKNTTAKELHIKLLELVDISELNATEKANAIAIVKDKYRF